MVSCLTRVSADGKLAVTGDNGNAGRSDGNVDTVTIIDIEANPPRVIDKVVVGDGPEGFAVSPTGRIAAPIMLGGSDGPKNSWFYNRNGSVAVLKLDGKKVVKDVPVGGIPEGAVSSPDGRWLYVGNYVDRNISVLRVDGDTVVNTGTVVPLPGSPASMRGRVQQSVRGFGPHCATVGVKPSPARVGRPAYAGRTEAPHHGLTQLG